MVLPILRGVAEPPGTKFSNTGLAAGSPDSRAVDSASCSNPKHVPGSPCYYVGMTSLNPEERFLQHHHGTKNVSMICHKYCRKLRMDLVPNRKPTRRTWAMRLEKRVAKELRRQGCGAWMG